MNYIQTTVSTLTLVLLSSIGVKVTFASNANLMRLPVSLFTKTKTHSVVTPNRNMVQTHHFKIADSYKPVRAKKNESSSCGRNLATKTNSILVQNQNVRWFIHESYVTGAKHEDTIINYVTWDGTSWTAIFKCNKFIHAPNGDFTRSHEDTIINYITWDGGKWTAKVEGNKFIHAPNGDFTRSHEDIIMNYITWGGSYWKATFKTP